MAGGLPVPQLLTGQLVAGALVALVSLLALNLDKLDIWPWALSAGVILRRLDRGSTGKELV
ncbi:hypothetical protein CPHO_01615 [Corynebacterium phocae]|uniref:Uncharacterized protein n=1 Tax=Corynebacterium phocae TaxID=161895 RepID=A0A1L7D147_9CORY|nr:hypothetical protein CPHO_01615 [Corynebacterium phocae]KAA8727935.1 hypothetical protein F4V58_01165 [Corynebacterium phocae]